MSKKNSGYVQLFCCCEMVTHFLGSFIAAQPSESVGKSKITSLLPYKDTLWVGTASGYLTIYRISKARAPSSPNGFNLEDGDNNQTDSEESDESLVRTEEMLADQQKAETKYF